jgi:hypothetical protein
MQTKKNPEEKQIKKKKRKKKIQMVALLLYCNSPVLSGVSNISQRNMFFDDTTIQILHPNIANFRIPREFNLDVLIISRRVLKQGNMFENKTKNNSYAALHRECS